MDIDMEELRDRAIQRLTQEKTAKWGNLLGSLVNPLTGWAGTHPEDVSEALALLTCYAANFFARQSEAEVNERFLAFLEGKDGSILPNS